MEDKTFIFGPFQFTPARGLLREGNTPIHLGNRAMEILLTLVECDGELVTHEEIVQRVWPNTFVSESNLRVHIRSIRRALREGNDGINHILNIPGRGYRFAVPVSVQCIGASLGEASPLPPVNSDLGQVRRSRSLRRARLADRYVVLLRGGKMLGLDVVLGQAGLRRRTSRKGKRYLLSNLLRIFRLQRILVDQR